MHFGPLIIANPLGLWALLGVPALVLIHFLQRKVRHIPVSTGFLLDHINFQSPQGSRFERFRSSIPFWLQLLIVLLLAAILAQIGWTTSTPLRRVAIVLDGSASMQVSRDRAASQLTDSLSPLAADNRLDITLSTSDASRTMLYRGDSVAAASQALGEWVPTASSHDPADALRTARALIGQEGVLLFLTDQQPAHTLPYSANYIAAGLVIENVGITSVRVISTTAKGNRFEAMVHNFGNNSTKRMWTVEFPELNTATTPRELVLETNATMRIEGALPPNATRAVIRIDNDEFAMDDAAPLVIPQPKRLTIATTKSVDPEAMKFWQRLAGSLKGTEWSNEEPDLIIGTSIPVGEVTSHYLIHLPPAAKDTKFRTDAITSSAHPALEGLNWQALAPRERDRFTPPDNATFLLWQGDVPIAWINRNGKFQQLALNFHPFSSSGATDPSLIVLCARFVENIRSQLPRSETLITETNAPLSVALPPVESTTDESPPPLYKWQLTAPSGATSEVWIEKMEIAQLSAPPIAGWFRLSTETGESLIDGSTLFADTREMNFRDAGTITDFDATAVEDLPAGIDNSTGGNIPWILTALALLVATWYFGREKASRQENSQPEFLRP